MRKLLALAVVTSLTACASSSYRPLSANDGNQASVYVIRQRAEPTAWNLWIYLNKEKVASVSNNSYVAFAAPAGQQTLVLDWPPVAASVKLDVPVKFSPGETRYFEVTGRIKMAGAGYQVMYFNESMQLVELSPAVGKQLVERMK